MKVQWFAVFILLGLSKVTLAAMPQVKTSLVTNVNVKKTPEEKANLTVLLVSKQVGKLTPEQTSKIKSLALATYTELAALKKKGKTDAYKAKKKELLKKLKTNIASLLTTSQSAKLKEVKIKKK